MVISGSHAKVVVVVVVVVIFGANCLKIGAELSGANCPGGELSDLSNDYFPNERI